VREDGAHVNSDASPQTRPSEPCTSRRTGPYSFSLLRLRSQ
jgi:hypothetical protein